MQRKRFNKYYDIKEIYKYGNLPIPIIIVKRRRKHDRSIKKNDFKRLNRY